MNQTDTISNFSTGMGMGMVLAIASLVAFIAPLVLSITSRSIISSCVSLALLAATAATMVAGKSVIHEILAAVFYLAAIGSASTIYAGSRIERAIKGDPAESVVITPGVR